MTNILELEWTRVKSDRKLKKKCFFIHLKHGCVHHPSVSFVLQDKIDYVHPHVIPAICYELGKLTFLSSSLFSLLFSLCLSHKEIANRRYQSEIQDCFCNPSIQPWATLLSHQAFLKRDFFLQSWDHFKIILLLSFSLVTLCLCTKLLSSTVVSPCLI